MAAGASAGRAPERVLLSLPAARESLPLARAVTGAVATDAGATIDVIDDARQVVTEAVALVLPSSSGAADGQGIDASAEVSLALEPTDGGVVIEVRGRGGEVDPFSFGWLLIDELSREASAQAADGRLHVRARVGGAQA